MGTTVRDLRQDVSSFLTAFDPALLTGEQAAVAVAEFSCIEKMAATGRMLAATRVAETAAWQGEGDKTPADWLARKAGTSVGEAAGMLGTGRKTRALPKTRRAMRKGKLSPSQAKAVADGAAAAPDAEDDLLDTAENETFQNLKRKAQKVRAAASDDASRDRRIRAKRSCRSHIDDDGAFNLHLRGPAADGARITALWKPLQEQRFRDSRCTGAGDSFDNRAYDAFLDVLFGPGNGKVAPRSPIDRDGASPTRQEDPYAGEGTRPGESGAERAATPGTDTHGAGDAPTKNPSGSGSVPAPSRAGADPVRGLSDTVAAGPRRTPGGANTKVIVRIDHTALLRGRAEPGETVEIVGLGQVSVATVKDLMRDAFIAAVIMKGQDVVNVAHLGRGVNAYQRTALDAVNVACSNIACNQSVAIEIDHRVPWVTQRETSLANQDPLCPEDHRKKTHEGWMLVLGRGRRLFVPPGHPRHPGSPGQPRPGPGRARSGSGSSRPSDQVTASVGRIRPHRKDPDQSGQATLC